MKTQCPRHLNPEWHPCLSRTCEVCKPLLDARDFALIRETLGGVAYGSMVARPVWDRFRKRAQRHGAKAIKIPARDGSCLVVSNDPAINDGQPVDWATVLMALRERPTGQDSLHLSGIGLPRRWG